MTSRDSVISSTAPSAPPPSRHRSLSNTSAKSKRSPSPIIAFTPTQLSSEAKGVKNITRKVIKRLEGLGHLEMSDVHEHDSEFDGEDEEEKHVDAALWDELNNAHEHTQNGRALNGLPKPGAPDVTSKSGDAAVQKIDWEIPRKLLHSSIGFLTLYLYVSEGNVRTVVVVLWSALCIIAPADIIRLRSTRFERIYERFLGALMRESEKKSTNGVIWYIIGVNVALTFYPFDVATVAILILSWADTAASTIGRLFSASSPRLPARLPILRLPMAPRKSLAGFLAASVTGACIAVGFWGWIAPMRNGGKGLSWTWASGLAGSSGALGGWLGLGMIGIVAGLVSGIAEALDLGSLDDNLTLPIISGGCMLGFFKLTRFLQSYYV